MQQEVLALGPLHQRQHPTPPMRVCEELSRLPTFACAPDKHPLSWNGHLDAIRGRDCANDPLTGVATGAVSGFDVLDVDPAGMDWLAGQSLPQTRTHATRRGGRHYLFRHAVGLRCSNSKIAQGVDVKADGGFIIWWPKEGLEVSFAEALAPWPEWLVEKAKASRSYTHIGDGEDWGAANGSGGPIPPAPTRNLYKRTKHLLRLLRLAPLGERNSILFFVSCRFAEMVVEGVIKETVAKHLLLGECRRCWGPDLYRDQATIASAFKTIKGELQ